MPTRDQFFKEVDGRSTEPFYMLKPKSQLSDPWYDDRYVPTGVRDHFNPLLVNALQAIVDNKKTVDEALAELVVKGQAALVQARKARKQGKNSGTKASNG